MSQPILFFGTDSFSAHALEGLLASSSFTVVAVITKPDTPSGRGQAVTPPIVKTLALAHNIPVWQPARIIDVAEDIKNLAAAGPIAGVLSSFGRIIPQEILDLFTPGIINVHPSLLPAYRGPTPIESAIINGDTVTGVSLMLLSARMDAGPVYIQATQELDGTETQATLYETLGLVGRDLLTSHLPAILDGSLSARAQHEAVATYSHLLSKADGTLDPASLTAAQAERTVRAHLVFPKTKIDLLGQSVILKSVHTSDTRTSLLDVTCADGRFLGIDQLVGPSGKTMSGDAFLNGYSS